MLASSKALIFGEDFSSDPVSYSVTALVEAPTACQNRAARSGPSVHVLSACCCISLAHATCRMRHAAATTDTALLPAPFLSLPSPGLQDARLCAAPVLGWPPAHRCAPGGLRVAPWLAAGLQGSDWLRCSPAHRCVFACMVINDLAVQYLAVQPGMTSPTVACPCGASCRSPSTSPWLSSASSPFRRCGECLN